MATHVDLQQQAINGIAAVEKSILEQAGKRNIEGLRLEWNEDLDFGHLMDPVPVVVITADGRTVEEHFSIQEMADFAAGRQAAVHAKVEHILEELAKQSTLGRSPESRGV